MVNITNILKRLAVAFTAIPIVLGCFAYPVLINLVTTVLTFAGIKEFMLIRSLILSSQVTSNTSGQTDKFQLPPLLPNSGDRLQMLVKQILVASMCPIAYYYSKNEYMWVMLITYIGWTMMVLTMFGVFTAPAGSNIFGGVKTTQADDSKTAAHDRPLSKEDFMTFCMDMAGMLYVGGGLALGGVLVKDWPILMLMMLFGNWMSDALAMAIGKQFGHYKLCPNLSPNKTVEGGVGAILGAVLAVFMFREVCFLVPLGSWLSIPAELYVVPSRPDTLFLGVIIGVLAIVGDLVESYFKRVANVKDSGDFFASHGGVLDRIDGLIFTFPIMFLFRHHFLPALA